MIVDPYATGVPAGSVIQRMYVNLMREIEPYGSLIIRLVSESLERSLDVQSGRAQSGRLRSHESREPERTAAITEQLK
jgi:hypothetical protein